MDELAKILPTPATERTLQSIDDTLKRIERVMILVAESLSDKLDDQVLSEEVVIENSTG